MKSKPFKHGLHWMRHDLRYTDNEALELLTQSCEQVLVVYIFDPLWLSTSEFGHCHLGKHRHRFLDNALVDINEQLSLNNISMLMLSGNPIVQISHLVHHFEIDCISYEEHFGFNERKQIKELQAKLESLAFIKGTSNYLLDHNALPFAIEDTPDVFSPFRRKVEKNLQLRQTLISIKPFIKNDIEQLVQHGLTVYQPSKLGPVNGYSCGETGAKERLNNYFFNSDHIARYKETRNGLDGWDFSSRFSSYLAAGCISPAFIVDKLKLYEQTRIKNDSTYWLFFELLWREFFHLQANKQNTKFFQYGGIQQNEPKNTINDSIFDMWKKGETSYPIVNACMNQLAATGFMSNRGRQLVASCFVHELKQDWRYGAAYFEEMLIDFDVASNFGNWQYLAGVGSDPRGHRQFNLDKQTDIYDPNQTFIKSWT
jgi:deoxyribodipyrimidine photo-lyase